MAARLPLVDFTGVQDFADLQYLAFKSADQSGDVFAVRRYRKDAGDTYGTKLQLVEADRVSQSWRRRRRYGDNWSAAASRSTRTAFRSPIMSPTAILARSRRRAQVVARAGAHAGRPPHGYSSVRAHAARSHARRAVSGAGHRADQAARRLHRRRGARGRAHVVRDMVHQDRVPGRSGTPVLGETDSTRRRQRDQARLGRCRRPRAWRKRRGAVAVAS
jgi:hypothetical protein